MKTQGEAGLTLIEIIVVVSIIAVLLGMVIPRFTNARDMAHNGAAEAYAHNVAVWLASAETSDQDIARGSLVGSCLNPKLQTEGAPNTFPGSVSQCTVDFQGSLYTVTVTAVTGKGGPTNNGIFTATY